MLEQEQSPFFNGMEVIPEFKGYIGPATLDLGEH